MAWAPAQGPVRSPSVNVPLAPLPDEALISNLVTHWQQLYLTSHRLIFLGAEKRLLVFPGGSRLAAAGIRDVDAVSVEKGYLPVMVLLLGLALLLGGLFGIMGTRFLGGDAVGGLVVLLLGLALVLLWAFFSTTILVFKVSGGQHISFVLSGFGDPLHDVVPFIDAYYRVKAQSQGPTRP